MWRVLDRVLARTGALAAWLVLPVSALLLAQWPLRDAVHAYSREANDLAQWLFALYVAVALTQATRARAHLAVPGVLRPAWRARVARAGALLCVLPWAAFILVAGASGAWQSVRGLEAFPDTFNPGYFLVKLAAWLLALLAAAQALRDAFGPAD